MSGRPRAGIDPELSGPALVWAADEGAQSVPGCLVAAVPPVHDRLPYA